jgi:hypothetical protein
VTAHEMRIVAQKAQEGEHELERLFNETLEHIKWVADKGETTTLWGAAYAGTVHGGELEAKLMMRFESLGYKFETTKRGTIISW